MAKNAAEQITAVRATDASHDSSVVPIEIIIMIFIIIAHENQLVINIVILGIVETQTRAVK